VDNVYYVDIVYDYGNSVNLYRFGDFLINNLVIKTESILKTYLPENMFKVRVNRINIPIEYQTINVSFTVSSKIDLGEISSYVVDHYPMNFLDNNDPL
jgi:hypothetical protein